MFLIPKEMRNISGFLTIVRLPLAAMFVLLLPNLFWAMTVMYVGAFTDIIDGIVARHLGQQSEVGGFADGWIDKVFNLSLCLGSWLYGYLPLYCVFLLFTREIIQIPMVPYFYRLYSTQQRFPPSSSVVYGKAATVILVVAISAALLQVFWVLILTSVLVCILGTMSSITYMLRDVDLFSKYR
jgi:cardiolipin synthase (CMP-forming)